MHSKEGIQKLQGSSSIIPTNSPIEAEAVALLMATQQMRRLQYRNVAFISDCKKLIDELHQCLAGKTITKARHTEVSSTVRDVHCISKSYNFTFHYASRSLLHNVDGLAKKARTCKQNYVISWLA